MNKNALKAVIAAMLVVSLPIQSFASVSVQSGPNSGSGFQSISGAGASKPVASVNDDGTWVSCYLENQAVKCRSYSQNDAALGTVTVVSNTSVPDIMNRVSVTSDGSTGDFWVAWTSDDGSKLRSYYQKYSKSLVASGSATEISPWTSSDWDFKVSRITFANNMLNQDIVASQHSVARVQYVGCVDSTTSSAHGCSWAYNGSAYVGSIGVKSGWPTYESDTYRNTIRCKAGITACQILDGKTMANNYYGNDSYNYSNQLYSDAVGDSNTWGTRDRTMDVNADGQFTHVQYVGSYTDPDAQSMKYRLKLVKYGLSFNGSFSSWSSVSTSAELDAKNKDGSDIIQTAAGNSNYYDASKHNNYHKVPTLLYTKHVEGGGVLAVFSYDQFNYSGDTKINPSGSSYGGLQTWYWSGANGSTPELVSANLIGENARSINDVAISRYGKIVVVK